ncbi:hypothetical protein Tco_0207996, partial [Tanacetum coccineum]
SGSDSPVRRIHGLGYVVLKVWDRYGVSMSAVSSQFCFSRKNQTNDSRLNVSAKVFDFGSNFEFRKGAFQLGIRASV